MIDLTQYQALTFDCYGTLIDWETGLRTFLASWSQRHRLTVPPEEWLENFAHAEAKAEADHPSWRYPKILKQVLDALAEQYRVSSDHELGEQLADAVGWWRPFPDTAPALRSLQRFYKLAVISNIDNESFSKSHRQLGVQLDLVVTAEDVGAYKPDLKIFTAALAQLEDLGVAKDRVLHVAQSLYHDHEPASLLGISSVWIDRRQGMDGTGPVAKPRRATRTNAVYGSLAAFNLAVEHAFYKGV